MKKISLIIAGVIFLLYGAVCFLLYTYQEKIIFRPYTLPKGYPFGVGLPYEELNIKSNDGALLNGLLFKKDSSKGLIIYLHGNGGSLATWGTVASTYSDLNYDVFIFDYRGFGKSDGKISSEKQLFDDCQTIYDQLQKKYSENKIVLLGYSFGTGLAAKLASQNNPRLLILQAPYYTFSDLMKTRFPIVPTFILKYPLTTNEYLKSCKMPIVIFHGTSDEVIPYEESLKLKRELGSNVTLIPLAGEHHNSITENETYLAELKRLLN